MFKDAFLSIIFYIKVLATLIGCVLVALPQSALAQSATVPSSTYKVADSSVFNLISSSGTTVSVSGLDPLKVVVSASAGMLKITTTTGLTAPTGYTSGDWSGANEIGFSGSLSNVNNALATLQFQGVGTITVSPTSSTILYSSITGNYYEFINTTSSWTAAQANANSQTLGSSTGYLATVTSSAEFTYIKSKAGLSHEIWLGGSDSAVEDEWRWMGGQENGQQFWQGNGSGTGGTAISGMYTSWNGTAEPNDSGGNEDCLAILTNGLWNDYPCSRTLRYVIEYDGGGVANSSSFSVAALLTPNQAFDAIKTNIETTSSENVYKNSVEHLRSSELTLQEKLAFHAEMVRTDASAKDTSSIDFNFSGSDFNAGMIAEGYYAKTDIAANQARRRILFDAKKVFFKNKSTTTVITGNLLYDTDISKKTSKQYRFGFKNSNDKRKQTLDYESDAKTFTAGTSLSHNFGNGMFGGLSADVLYSFTKSEYANDDTTVTGEMRTYSISTGSQLSGQYESDIHEGLCKGIWRCQPDSSKFWVKPTLSFSYNEEWHISQTFTSTTGLGSTSVYPQISMPKVARLTLQNEFLHETKVNMSGKKSFLSAIPSFSCEKLKTTSDRNQCRTGLYTEFGVKSQNGSSSRKLYFNYENLNLGPRHEYGLLVKIMF